MHWTLLRSERNRFGKIMLNQLCCLSVTCCLLLLIGSDKQVMAQAGLIQPSVPTATQPSSPTTEDARLVPFIPCMPGKQVYAAEHPGQVRPPAVQGHNQHQTGQPLNYNPAIQHYPVGQMQPGNHFVPVQQGFINAPAVNSPGTQNLDVRALQGVMQVQHQQFGNGTQRPYLPGAPHGRQMQTAGHSANNQVTLVNGNITAADGSTIDPHAAVYSGCEFPSAKECRTCHEKIYEEWSVSSHAYASVSPMFHKFEQTINNLAQGTLGYFCLRCHAPVATTQGLSRDEAIWNGSPAAKEGVTCVACHRVKERYGRVNGERRMEPGPVTAPVYGAGNGQTLQNVISQSEKYKVKTTSGDKTPGQPIHQGIIQFEQISSSHFCVSCHQVAVYPGIKLEVVWEQYRASPAAKEGISCQDCHMGKVAGKHCGYETAPSAIVNEIPINPRRKHSNHIFFGPGTSIAHPGIFPMNPKADRWTMNDWLKFDWRAGWGTEEFENRIDDGLIKVTFPKVWEFADDRYDARDIITENQRKLAIKNKSRHALMENASKVTGPFFDSQVACGSDLNFHYVVKNQSNGHNMPSGSLGAQPQIWLNVSLTGPEGTPIWESGYVDGNGDLADLHSLEVAAGRIPHDDQLFNLQTKFLITGVKGPDREFYLPINMDFDQLPFIRPSGFPITTMNHPPFIRMEGHSLPPLGEREAKYSVPGKFIQRRGRYRLSVRMRSRSEPIYFMRFCQATPEMERAMNDSIVDFHEYAVDFHVK
ncbi:MAG: multiheme c-type cytochrome [Planctomycetaceae bacterium]